MNILQFCLLYLAGRIDQNQQRLIDYLREEIKVLREQLGRKPRFTDRQRIRLAAKAKHAGVDSLCKIVPIVSPETLLRWHRRLIARKYDGTSKRSPGRPRTADTIRGLILRFARENPTWGYTRIQGALGNLGHKVARGTVANVLQQEGIDPAPDRGRRSTWKQFLRAHWQLLAAGDFFTVEVWTALGLVRYHVFFVIRLATRDVHIAGIVPEPHARWMQQIARNLTDGFEGVLNNCKYLIHDRSTLYTEQFRALLLSAGVQCLRLPPCSPNLNAFAERFVRSIKEECLDRLILVGERSLRRAVSDYVEHYRSERNHQGLENKLIQPEFSPTAAEGHLVCRERLGGMLRYYHRKAA